MYTIKIREYEKRKPQATRHKFNTAVYALVFARGYQAALADLNTSFRVVVFDGDQKFYELEGKA